MPSGQSFALWHIAQKETMRIELLKSTLIVFGKQIRMIPQASFDSGCNVMNNASFIPGAVGYEVKELCVILFAVSSLIAVEDLINGNVQCIGDPNYGLQAGVFDAGLDMAYVGYGHSGVFSQICLGHLL